MVITDEDARERFMEMARNGKITCRDCMILADELQTPTNEIATTLTEMNIKIIKCQLGCFP